MPTGSVRCATPAEVDDLDLDASMDDAVTLVEWGEGIVEQLADTHLTLRIERRDDETRVVTIEPSGPDWVERVAAIDLDAIAAHR